MRRPRSRPRPPLALLAGALLLLGGCAPAPPAAPAPAPAASPSPAARPRQDVRIGMAFIPNVQFAPFYVADAKGYFAAEGINPVYDYGFEQDVVALTAQGQLAFTNAGAATTIIARSHGVPVRYFLKEYQSMPIAVFALNDKGISRLSDLKGRTVGQPLPSGDSYIGFTIMLRKAGLRESDLNVLTINFTQVESILTNKVDAAVGYSLNEPLQLRAQGREVVEFDLKDVAPEVAGNGIIASERTLSEQPELARAFARAFLRGLADTISNPQEAFDISLRFVPEAGKDEQVRQTQLETLQLLVNDYLKTSGALGASDLQQWQQTQTLLKESGLVERETDMSQAVTNEFLPT